MKKIIYERDWTNKLKQDIFLHLEIKKYYYGEEYQCYLKDDFINNFVVIFSEMINKNNLTEIHSLLISGKRRKEFLSLLSLHYCNIDFFHLTVFHKI